MHQILVENTNENQYLVEKNGENQYFVEKDTYHNMFCLRTHKKRTLSSSLIWYVIIAKIKLASNFRYSEIKFKGEILETLIVFVCRVAW